MDTPSSPKSSGIKLTAINTVVATLAGIISITGGLYSLKNSMFQAPAEGMLEGIVRDEAIAKPLKEASVEISTAGNLVVSTLYTDQSGRYETGKLKEGPYLVKVSAVRHVPQVKTVNLIRNQTSTVHFDLVPVADEIKEPSASVSQFRPSPSQIPVYAPSRSAAPVPRPVYQPESRYDNPPFRESYQPSVRRQQQVARPSVGQSLLQTGLELLGDYAAKRNQPPTAAGAGRTNQNASTDQSSQSPYSKENS